MRITRRGLLASLMPLLALPLHSQTFRQKYFLFYELNLSGAGEVITLVNPTSEGRKLALRGLYVVSENDACRFTLERDGASPGGTAITSSIKKASKGLSSPSIATAYRASTVSVGTVINKILIAYPPDSKALPFDATDLPGDGSNSNFTIRIASMTGYVSIYLEWEEV